MSTRNKYESRARADDTGSDPQGGGTSKLLQRLLHKMAGTDGQQRGDGAPKPPPGHRSGSGADSVAPYLDEARNSRPGPLE
ncbi:hypothetical protein [Ramlibacter montanisoli]|uniref:Uncharacterized protein n=1 Tax=Ramlibacter montanisoli TaxID=2732512 RepID=A0A849KBF9_9BURK|nr:hypothetical protein [Ramlibacter montanisoli]NNU43784.1 hypothetical protein [Ramlibacter montanisoli]